MNLMPHPDRTARRKITRRVAKACDRCRSKKDRCDGVRPTCGTCAASERRCSYNIETKRRGLPEGYVRTLERLWGLAMLLVPEMEDVLLEMVTGEDLGVRDVSRLWNADTDEDSCFSSWRKTALYNEVHRQLTSGEGTMFVGGNSREFGHGAGTSDAQLRAVAVRAQSLRNRTQPMILEDDSPNEADTRESNTAFKTLPNPASRGHDLESRHETSPSTSDDEFSRIPSHRATQLVQHYMKNTNTWLPMMNQAEIMRLLYRSNQGHALESDEQALFAAIITYSTIQTSSSLGVEGNEEGRRNQTTDRDALVLQHKVDRLLPRHGKAGSIANVQAMLILAMINIGRGDWQDAWSMIGRATRLATYLKLSTLSSLPHQPLSASSAYGASRSINTLLACFVLETVLSTRLALPPHLRTEDLSTVEAVDCSGMDEWEPWSGAVKASTEHTMHHGPSFSASTFNGLVEVAKLLQSARKAQDALCSSMEDWKHLWNQFALVRKKIEEQLDNTLGVSEAGGSMLPHQIFLRFTLETALSALFRYYPGRASCPMETLMEDDILSLTNRIGGLLEKQAGVFSLTTVYPVYLPLMETTFNNIAWLQREFGSSERLEVALSGVKQLAQALAEVWTRTTPDGVVIQETRVSAREGHDRSRNQSSIPVFPQRDSPVKPQNHLARASHATTGQIPPKVNSSSPSVGHLITGGSTDVRTLSSVGTMAAASEQMQPPALPEWSRGVPDAALFTEPVSVAAATAPDGLEDTYSHTASSLGDRDFESAFHEMLTSDTDSWSQSWSQSLMNLGFCNTESMRHISGDMFMTNDRPPP